MAAPDASAQSAQANTSVNLRAGPGTIYSVITTIPAGGRVTIMGCTAGYKWCGVNYNGTEGYAAGQYLTVISGNYSGQIITAVGVGVALSIPLWRYNDCGLPITARRCARRSTARPACAHPSPGRRSIARPVCVRPSTAHPACVRPANGPVVRVREGGERHG